MSDPLIGLRIEKLDCSKITGKTPCNEGDGNNATTKTPSTISKLYIRGKELALNCCNIEIKIL